MIKIRTNEAVTAFFVLKFCILNIYLILHYAVFIFFKTLIKTHPRITPATP